jgi:hypothetical protein
VQKKKISSEWRLPGEQAVSDGGLTSAVDDELMETWTEQGSEDGEQSKMRTGKGRVETSVCVTKQKHSISHSGPVHPPAPSVHHGSLVH